MWKNLLLMCLYFSASTVCAQSVTFQRPLDTLSSRYIQAIVELRNGNLIVAGASALPAAPQDCFIAGLDSMADILWADTINSPSADAIISMVQLNDSIIVACALWNILTSTNNDLRLIWFDLQGNIIHSAISNVGNGGNWCRRLIRASNGDLIMTGYAVD
ncbi:MAG TPA: hypothetical protein PLI08_10410, partial [Bacteroidia bacterium]|nr:hypothetical protein [Bacteroidia bacterium]